MSQLETNAGVATIEAGAAGLLVAAARADGAYTEVERDGVTKALMRLFQSPSPAATALRQDAERALDADDRMTPFAEAVRAAEADTREKLLEWIWVVLDRNTGECDAPAFVNRVADCWAMPRPRAKALRPTTS